VELPNPSASWRPASLQPKKEDLCLTKDNAAAHIKAGEQSHKKTSGSQQEKTLGGTDDQHVKAGEQSHKNTGGSQENAGRAAYLKRVGTMVARASCVFQQRVRYGFIGPNEASVRAIAMSYATKVDNKRMSITDAYLATQRDTAGQLR
jgi:hypothetical protein